jgi:hypothetical protein
MCSIIRSLITYKTISINISRRGKVSSLLPQLAGARERQKTRKQTQTRRIIFVKRKQKAHNIGRSYAYYFFLLPTEKSSLYTSSVLCSSRSCCIFRDMSSISTPQRLQSSRRKENLRDLPTDENHWPVLHVFQLADARVFGLFAFYSGADQVE